MQLNVGYVFNSSVEEAAANNYGNNIKLMQVDVGVASKTFAMDDLSKILIPWSAASNISIPGFSATCWFSGKSIVDGRRDTPDAAVPLGLVATT
jgi:hypothetical protein